MTTFKSNPKNQSINIYVNGKESTEEELRNKIKEIINVIDKNNIYNLTHNSDIDGISSSALLLHNKIINNINNIIFCNYSGKINEEAISKINSINKRDACLIITDFNDTSQKFLNVLKKFKENNNHIILLDHHPVKIELNKDYINMFDAMVFGENKDQCGTDLVEKFIKLKSDDVEQKLIELAHRSDFYLYKETNFQNIIEKLSDVIDYINEHSKVPAETKNLRKLVDIFANENIENNEFIEKIYEKSKKNEEKYLQELNNNITTLEVKDIKIGIGFSKSIKSNKACEYIFSKTNADIAIFINRKSHNGSIRTKHINSISLAQSLNGNGHSKASGFNIDDKINLKNKKGKKGTIELIKEKAYEVYPKLERIE